MKTKTFLAATLLIALVNPRATAQLLTDFESYSNAVEVMFQEPGFSGTTAGNLSTAATNFSTTADNPLANPNPNGGNRVYSVSWTFDEFAPNPWIRLTTFNAPNLANPTVDFTQSIQFDIFSDSAIYVGLGLRETSTTAAIGANGGASGTIEFVGGRTDNTTTPPKGALVAANTWTTLKFDLPTEPIRGFTGDGVLTSTTGKGVLEMLTLVPFDVTDTTYNLYVDNFAVVPIPEPSTWALLALGGFTAAVLGRRRRS
jgi:hypothetical protein